MLKLAIALTSIFLCFVLPRAKPRWDRLRMEQPLLALFLMGLFCATAVVLSVVLSSVGAKEFYLRQFLKTGTFSMLAQMQFHHVGVLTPDVTISSKFYEVLGYAQSEVFDDPIQKVRIVLMTRTDGPMIELIQPSNSESPAFAWLKRIQSGAYHTCYRTPAIEDRVEELRDHGFMPLTDCEPAVAFAGKRVCFLWSAHAGLLELVEA